MKCVSSILFFLLGIDFASSDTERVATNSEDKVFYRLHVTLP